MVSIVSGGFSLKFPVYNGHFNLSIYKMEIFCLEITSSLLKFEILKGDYFYISSH